MPAEENADTSVTTLGGSSEQASVPVSAAIDRKGLRRVIAGAAIGQGVEWYDYAIYGYLAGSIGAAFFPSDDHAVTVLAAYAAFAVSFLIRPLGGLIFGVLGDRMGRRTTLALVVTIISAATFLIGVLPGYAVLGVAAPIILLVLRLVQGLSAGGELAGAVSFLAEHSPRRRRGLIVGIGEVAASAGPLFGATLVALLAAGLSQDAVDDWAWRIPFVLAGPIGLIGLYLRLRVEETPIFRAILAAGEEAKAPIREALRNNTGAIVRCTGVAITHLVPYYLILAYLPNHLAESGRLPDGSAYFVTVIALVVKIATIPVATMLSDRAGRRPLLAVGAIGYAVLGYPLFALMDAGGLAVVLICQVILGVLFGIYSGCVFAMMVEMFPARTRFTSLAISYNAAAAIFGGTAPLIATWLVAVTEDGRSAALYMIFGAVISLIAIAMSRETGRGELDPQGDHVIGHDRRTSTQQAGSRRSVTRTRGRTITETEG